MVITDNASTLFARLLAGAVKMWFFTYAFVNMGIFFCNHPATTEIYTLSLHDALPIPPPPPPPVTAAGLMMRVLRRDLGSRCLVRSEEHTSELQSRRDLVCRLLLE